MKFKNILYSTTVAAVLLLGSCKKDKFDINSNPDDVTDVSVTPTVLLPGALQTTSAIVATDWDFLQMWMGYWARSGSYQSLTEIETYRFTNSFQTQIWNDLYANANNYNLMITKAQESGAGTYEAIGRIMKSHNFQILVDVYNNVPYFEAFKGTEFPTPKYDKGADIYKDLFAQLDTAITLLSNADATSAANNPEIATADLVYKGNTASWKRFANTLRLRMIMHLHNGATTTQVVPGFNISEQVGKITSEGYIGAGQSAHLNPGFVATKPNPYYRAYVANEAGTTSQRDHIRANAYAVEYYEWNGDPRLDRVFVAPSGGHLGITFGTPSGNDDLIGSNLSTVRAPGYLPDGASSRAWILTSVESMFLQAEAAERGVIPGTAKTLLNAAITESFVWLGLKAADATAYITGNATYEDVDYDAPGGGLFTILTQKWFAMNGLAAYEVWTDHRRTDVVIGAPAGYKPNIPGPPISVEPANTATKIPLRLLYPQNEFNYNAENVAGEGTVNVFTNKIFWDLN